MQSHFDTSFLGESCLDHVAIAVESLESAKSIYEAIGFSFDDNIEKVESQGVRVCFARVDQKAKIELLEPLADQPNSAIARYLAKQGSGGIHHLCFKVPNVDELSKKLVEQNYRLIYPEPVEGAGGMRVNFIHPKSTGGVLVEISTPIN